MQQSKGLPHPYGDCEEDYILGVTECQQNCRDEIIAKICSCHDVYMKHVSMNGGLFSVIHGMIKLLFLS